MVKTALAGTFQFILKIVFLRLVFKFVPRLSLSFRFREEGRPSGRLRKVIKKRPIFRGMRKGKQAQYCRKESAERLRGEQSSLTKEESKEKLSAKERRGGGGRGEESLEHFRALWRSSKSYIKSLTKIFRNPLPTVNK